MHLLIRAVSLAGQPLTQAISAYFDERGGTIGRSDTNTLALPDPERRISRLQAEVSRSPDGWRILNVGNANPIWHNDRPVPPGEGALLDEGDELQIGTYALQVTYSQNDLTARTITKGRAAVDSRSVIVGSGREPRTDPRMMRPADTAEAPSCQMGAGGSVGALSGAPGAQVGQAAVGPSAQGSQGAAPSPAAPASSSPFADLLGDWASSPAPSSSASTPAGVAPSASPSTSPFADLAPAPAASVAFDPFQGLGQSVTPAPAPPAASKPSPWQPASAAPSPPAASSSPFADLLGFGAAPAAQASGTSPASASVSATAPARLPDDFDPFADFQAAPSSAGRAAVSSSSWDLPQTPAAPASASPFDFNPGAAPALPGDLDLMGAVTPAGAGSIDQIFGLGSAPGGAAHADPLADFLKRTEPAAPSEAPAGAPSQLDPLALLASREEVRDAPTLPATQQVSALPDDVPELQGAMPLPAVRAPAAKPERPDAPPAQPAPQAPLRETMSASFSFMPPPAKADMPTPAAVQGSSPFADLGLGGAPTLGLLDALDLTPETVPSVRAARAEAARALDLSTPVGHAPLSEPLLTQLPTPQTAVPHAPYSPLQAEAAAPSPSAQRSGPTPPANSVPSPAAPSADLQALWAAFAEGAGVSFTPPQGLNADLMRVIGQLLHHAVDGSLKLVAARAATKQEMRAEVTVIQSRRNNPLKFSPDTRSAMEQLLQPPMRGFMSGPEAVADAMDDLLGHTIGTMVGMRAALDGVLARFEPDQLEAKLSSRSMVDTLVPMHRRAKLWELYLQHYGAVRNEAQDDFHNLFGRAFLQAYEEQLDRLHAERHQANQRGTPGQPA
jgi:FHA domain-containing protein